MSGMDAKAATRCWFHPKPAWLVYGAAAATGILAASERWRWFPLHYQKGWPVLLAVAVLGAVLIMLAAWIVAAVLFRRQVQFGLRTLLAFVTLCALVCSWMAVRLREARRQAVAVAAIREDGDVRYDWQMDDNHQPLPNPLPPGPEPLRKLLGLDFFAKVIEVHFGVVGLLGIGDKNFDMNPGNDTQMEVLQGLPDIRFFYQGYFYREVEGEEGEEMTDAGLAHLQGHTQLEELRLSYTHVTSDTCGSGTPRSATWAWRS
jgi:hypothetical protein